VWSGRGAGLEHVDERRGIVMKTEKFVLGMVMIFVLALVIGNAKIAADDAAWLEQNRITSSSR
jgi:hypothetical protein